MAWAVFCKSLKSGLIGYSWILVAASAFGLWGCVGCNANPASHRALEEGAVFSFR